MKRETLRYRKIDLVNSVYILRPDAVKGTVSRDAFNDVEGIPFAGGVDILLPNKDGSTQVVSIGWGNIKVAIRVVAADVTL